jgi:hypothetical protein
MVLLNLDQCHQQLSPLKLILQWIYVNGNPFTKTQSSLHNIENKSMYLLMDKIVESPILNLFLWTNLFSQVLFIKRYT